MTKMADQMAEVLRAFEHRCMHRNDDAAEQAPLAADGGIPFKSRNGEPFARFFELMEVIEALCPTWPPREHKIEGIFLL